MDAKLLTENGWKTTAQKSKVRDNGLQRALATYEKLDETKLAEQMEALASVSKLATNLKKVREVASNEDAADYLENVAKAAEAEKKRIAPQAAKASEQAAKLKTWAAKIIAADKKKPDFAKFKTLLTEVGTIAKRPSGGGAGPARGKGNEAEVNPCLDYRNEVLEKGVVFGLSATTAASLIILTAAAAAAAAEAAAAVTVSEAVGLMSANKASEAIRALLAVVAELRAALIGLGVLWIQYYEAYQAWHRCTERQAALDAADEWVRNMYERLHRQRYREQQQRWEENFRRWGGLYEPRPNP